MLILNCRKQTSILLNGTVQDAFASAHNAEINYAKIVATQNNGNDILANVVHVSFDCS